MVDCFTQTTAHLFKKWPALEAQYKLRYRIFIEKHNWDVPSYNGLEYDQYDTPSAVYFTSRNKKNEVQGMIRMLPTDRPYMLQEIFPYMFTKFQLPKSDKVGELTRFTVDHNISNKEAEVIFAKIIIGALEYGIEHKFESYISLTPIVMLRKIRNMGCRLETAGEPHKFDGMMCNSVIYEISKQVLLDVRNRTGIIDPVLNKAENQYRPLKEMFNHVLSGMKSYERQN